MDAKYSKIIVRDSSGNLVQLLPEVKVATTINPNSSLPVTSSAVAAYGSEILAGIVKEVKYSTVEPTAANTEELDNGSLIFWEQTEEQSSAWTPVYVSGNQIINGTKTFTSTISGSIDGNAATATRASQDASGNDIEATYAAKSEMPTTYAGATSSSAGTAGLVPAASIAEKDRFLKGDGTWAELTLPSDYVGATSSASGVHGLVPAATSAERDYYLKGDGTWGPVSVSGGSGVQNVYAELASDSEHSSETTHETLDGWIGSSVASEEFAFNVSFGYTTGGSGGSYSSIDRTITTFTSGGTSVNSRYYGPKFLKSNVHHVCDFTFNGTFSLCALHFSTSTHTITTLADGSTISGSYCIAGNEQLASSSYTSWTFDDSYIEVTFPSAGDYVQFDVNGMYSAGSYSEVSDRNMHLKLTCLGGSSYRLDFWWEYEDDVYVENSRRWKELKTTVVLPDNTTTSTVRSISGLLQDVDGSVEETFENDYVTVGGTEVPFAAQHKSLVLSKEDVDGTKSTATIEMKPSVIASYTTSTAGIRTGDVVDGFVCGLDSSNLSIGGLYLEVDSTFVIQD